MALLDRDKRLRFLNLTERDVQLLQALRPLMLRHAAVIVDSFYGHLQSFPETAGLLHDWTMLERLKQLLRGYLVQIVEGNFDDTYFAERRRIGQTHERVGMAPRWYLLAHSYFFRALAPLIRDFYPGDSPLANDTIHALEKVLMLDASLAMDAYIASDRYRHLQQLESIVNDSADVIFLLDAEKRFRAWNRAAEQIFGWPAEEVLGKPVTIVIPPEQIESGELDRIDREMEAKGHYHLETVRLARDGRRVPVELTLSLLRDPQGHPIGRSVILRDITERKRLEEAKLQSERLAVIGTMSAKLAHEIRNPLTSIRLNIDLVKDEIEDLAKRGGVSAAEARTLLGSIDAEVHRIQMVTEDYLKFARLPKPRRERLGLNELLLQQLPFLQSLFDSAKVQLETKFDPALPAIRADEGQLWQAILNLIRNAVEAMPNGGKLCIQTFSHDDSVSLCVADTGHGMGERELAQLFKPFFSTKTGGTGLGLPLTQQIVVEHEGQIDCQTSIGQGTTFIIHLPQSATET